MLSKKRHAVNLLRSREIDGDYDPNLTNIFRRLILLSECRHLLPDAKLPKKFQRSKRRLDYDDDCNRILVNCRDFYSAIDYRHLSSLDIKPDRNLTTYLWFEQPIFMPTEFCGKANNGQRVSGNKLLIGLSDKNRIFGFDPDSGAKAGEFPLPVEYTFSNLEWVIQGEYFAATGHLRRRNTNANRGFDEFIAVIFGLAPIAKYGSIRIPEQMYGKITAIDFCDGLLILCQGSRNQVTFYSMIEFFDERHEDVKIPFDHSLPLKPLYRFDAYKCVVEIFGHPYKALYRKCVEGTKSKVANHYQVAELNFDHVTEKIETSELKHEELSSTGSHEARNVFVHPSGSCAQIMQIHSNDNQQHELRVFEITEKNHLVECYRLTVDQLYGANQYIDGVEFFDSLQIMGITTCESNLSFDSKSSVTLLITDLNGKILKRFRLPVLWDDSDKTHTVSLESDKLIVITETADGDFSCDVFHFVETIDEPATENRPISSPKRRRNR